MNQQNTMKILIQYIVFGFSLGIICGGACLIFCFATTLCNCLGQSHEILLFFLPLAGLLVVYLYDRKFKNQTLDTNSIYRYLTYDKPISKWQAPLIFLSTCLAYIFSGSVGRAGSALQIGSGLAYAVGAKAGKAEKVPAVFAKNIRPDMLMACGMAAAFTAIFKTPFAGAVFGVEMLVLTRNNISLLLPSAIAAFATYGMACLVSVPYTDIHTDFASDKFDPVAINFQTMWKVAVIALCAALLGRIFCLLRRYTDRWFKRGLKNPFIRVLVGTGMVIVVTLLIGHNECNGLGYAIAGMALDGETRPLNFVFKLVLTLITLGCGIRGGEISPNIFIGATFGCTAAGFLGMNPCLAASVGMIGTLSSVTNSTIAIFIMGLELISFTPEAAVCFALTCLITHLTSGTLCLYTGQETHRMPLKIKLKKPADRKFRKPADHK